MRRQQSKSVVFLTELLLALMIFALCSSVCAGLFAWSHRIEEQSSALSHAVVMAQSGAEAFKRYSAPDTLARMMEGTATDSGCTIYYDKDWATTASDGAAYVMTIQLRQEAGLRFAEILVSVQDGVAVYRLEASALRTEGGL
ncbi:MAG: hypothetical protein FWH28_00565 [Clostridiales bacterium]|nr:hypothetical protein [Clostridiales bacterium]